MSFIDISPTNTQPDEDLDLGDMVISHIQETWDLLCRAVSMSLTLMLMSTWNSYIYATMGSVFVQHFPGIDDSGSLSFALCLTLFVFILFLILSFFIDRKIGPKQILIGLGAKAFTDHDPPR